MPMLQNVINSLTKNNGKWSLKCVCLNVNKRNEKFLKMSQLDLGNNAAHAEAIWLSVIPPKPIRHITSR